MTGATQPTSEPIGTPVTPGRWPEVLRVFFLLGLTSFGGPVAHLGYFREAFVVRRRWLDERSYADLVALCQFLPGPASSQVCLAIGLSRAGYAGAAAAWIGFTLPSALLLVLFALGVAGYGDVLGSAWLQGLKVAAVVVVAHALWGMAKALTPDAPRGTLAVIAAIIALSLPSIWGQLAAIGLGAVVGLVMWRQQTATEPVHLPLQVGRRAGAVALALFFLLLAALPLLAIDGGRLIELVDAFYRSGSLVFGGGHVVLPLLQSEVVPTGLIGSDDFLAGYGAAQAVPGPLFTFAAYLGAVITVQDSAWLGALVCLLAIFLPSFLLVIGVLPFWQALRRRPAAQAALTGVNAAVVGLLLAAFYHPVFTAGILDTDDFALAAVCFLLLAVWRLPQWLIVIVGAAGASLIALIPSALPGLG